MNTQTFHTQLVAQQRSTDDTISWDVSHQHQRYQDRNARSARGNVCCHSVCMFYHTWRVFFQMCVRVVQMCAERKTRNRTQNLVPVLKEVNGLVDTSKQCRN